MAKSITDRAKDWYGASNLARMTKVPLGRGRVAFVTPTRLWIYSENSLGWRVQSTDVNLTPKMRAELLAALAPFPAENAIALLRGDGSNGR